MGTGASSQVRSRSENTNDILLHAGQNFKQMANERLFCSTTNVAAIRPSNTIPDKNSIINESQKTSHRSATESQISSCDIKRIFEDENKARVEVDTSSNHELQHKIQELEQALAMSESQKLDLQDQVQLLEERISNTATEQTVPNVADITDMFHRTLNSKDQQIKKLEEDMKCLQAEFKRQALMWKKRVRGLTNQISELKQEASITQMELRSNMAQQHDQTVTTSVTNEDKRMPDEACASSSSQSKLIIELSSQISEQDDHISRLTTQLAQKNVRISELEAVLRDLQETSAAASTDHSSLHSEVFSNDGLTVIDDTAVADFSLPHRKPKNSSNFVKHTQNLPVSLHKRNGIAVSSTRNNSSLTNSQQITLFEHCSTALSDSDSDWENESSYSHAVVHSAPPHIRLRSNMSTSYGRML